MEKGQKKNTGKIRQGTILDTVVKVFWMTWFALLAISLIFSALWMIFSGLKTDLAYFLNNFNVPFDKDSWTLDNYRQVLQSVRVRIVKNVDGYKQIVSYGVVEMIIFTIIPTFGGNIIGILTPCVTAYIVSKYDFKLKNFLYSTAIFTMILPVIGSTASTLQLRSALGVQDNMLMHILTSGMPFGMNFLLFYGAWKSIDWAYSEAAFIDGASNTTVFFRIMLPMMMPTCATLFILGFMGGWNDYMTSIMFLPSYPSIARGMFEYNTAALHEGVPENIILAGFAIVAIPSMLIFLFTRKLTISNMKIGGLKG